MSLVAARLVFHSLNMEMLQLIFSNAFATQMSEIYTGHETTKNSLKSNQVTHLFAAGCFPLRTHFPRNRPSSIPSCYLLTKL